MKIAEVSEKTGVSRELVHHYLRQGLLPRSTSRAHYSEQQIRLLRQIKTLREDHHLPLEVIRGVFDFFGFDPQRVEALTEADSLSRRMTRLATAGEILSSRTITAAQLIDQVEISADRLAAYVEARLVSPARGNGVEVYSVYDAKVIALCEHGVRLGMPFESLRNVGSYVRVAYELEHPELLQLAPDLEAEPDHIMGILIARLEVITSFIQSLLQSLISRHVQDFHLPEGPGRASLDHVIYRPSPVFLRRHRLDHQQEEAQQLLSDSPDRPRGWIHAARLLLHAGRYHEAVFLCEKGLERLTDPAPLRQLYGRALLLAGQVDRAAEVLAQSAGDPLSGVYQVLLRYGPPDGEATPPGVPDTIRCVRLLEAGLAAAQHASGHARHELRILAGWLLTALPQAMRDAGRGLAVLADTYRELRAEARPGQGLPGLSERQLINAAYLLLDAGGRHATDAELPEAEELRTLVCRLDPGCGFAEAVFLMESPPQGAEETP